MPPPKASDFLAAMQDAASLEEADKTRRRMTDSKTDVIGVRMKVIFDTAKSLQEMSLVEVNHLLDSQFYEARMGAVSILDFQVRRPRITDVERQARYELYLDRHNRINTWDLVDRAAPRVVGWYLLDKSRAPLYALAHSSDWWERRSAITAAFWLIRSGDLGDPLALAEILASDPEHFVQTSVGVALREIGIINEQILLVFLNEHAASMPRDALRMAIAKLQPNQRRAYLNHDRG